MSACSEEVIYIANYKNSFLAYLDLFVMETREPARGEIRNLESDIFDARMDLRNKLNYDDTKISSIQERALKDFLINHEINYVQKLRVILFFGIMKYTGKVENLQLILNI